MSELLTLRPKYIASLKRMSAITGSTADPYVADDIMANLRRGMHATGLLDHEGNELGAEREGSRRNSRRRSVDLLSRSFTRARSGSRDASSKEAIEAREREAEREREHKRNLLSHQRTELVAAASASRASALGRRSTVVGAGAGQKSPNPLEC